MNKEQTIPLSVAIVRWSIQNCLEIQYLNKNICMQGEHAELNIPLNHLLDLVGRGWAVEEVLDNELCYKE